MVDTTTVTINDPVVVPASTASTAIAPVEPVQAPVIEATTVVAPVQEVAPAPVVEAVIAPVVEPVKPVESLLGEAPKEIAPVEPVAPTAETKEGQSDEPAPPPEVTEIKPPVYEPFKAPEGVTLDAERVSKFTELLSELELGGKADHAFVQEFGQKAVDFHINEVKKAAEDVTKLYQTTWERQKNDWKESFLKDPEIGGNRFQTTLDAAKTFIRTHGGTPEQQTEFRTLMDSSGLGNHPTMIRILAKAGMAMSEGKPLAASKPAEAPKSKTATLYGRG